MASGEMEPDPEWDAREERRREEKQALDGWKDDE